MTQDISSALRQAFDRRASWSPREVRRLLEAVIAVPGAATFADWDEDAGEDWARVVDDAGVVALVSARLPIVIARSSLITAGVLGLPPEPEVVPVDATDTSLLRADAEALSTAFPEIEQALADNQTSFAREGFTADELWFLTV